MPKSLSAVVLFILLLIVPSCSGQEDGQGGFKQTVDAEVGEKRPKKPVRINLKRTAEGKYSWEITGDNPDEIIEADKKLRKYIKPGAKAPE